MPDVSIIIPTHRRPDLLPRAVESARASGSNVEIIVVDDASTDATAEICRKLETVKYIRVDRNQGVAGARNLGILASSAEYIGFLDDDDLRLPGSLDLQVQALDNNPDSGFVCGAMMLADQQYNPTGETSVPKHPGGDAFWELLELDFPVMPLCTLIRKSCLFQVGLLNTHLHGIDDWDILVRLAELYPIIVLRQVVGLYRKPTPASGQGSSAQYAQLRRAARHQLQLFHLPRAKLASAEKIREVRRRTLQRIADTLLWSGVKSLRRGEWRAACSNISTALSLSPLRIAHPAAYKKLAFKLADQKRQRKSIGAGE